MLLRSNGSWVRKRDPTTNVIYLPTRISILSWLRTYLKLSASQGLANASGGDEAGEGDASSAAEGSGGGDELPWAYTSDDSISFPVDCVLQGDLLVSWLSTALGFPAGRASLLSFRRTGRVAARQQCLPRACASHLRRRYVRSCCRSWEGWRFALLECDVVRASDGRLTVTKVHVCNAFVMTKYCIRQAPRGALRRGSHAVVRARKMHNTEQGANCVRTDFSSPAGKTPASDPRHLSLPCYPGRCCTQRGFYCCRC